MVQTQASELTAKQRKGKKDAVHLFERDSSTPLCDGWQLRETKFRDEDYNVEDLEKIVEEDYLVVDGEIVGKICGKCQNLLCKASRFNVEGGE